MYALAGEALAAREIQQQVPPLRFAPVGMTNFIEGQGNCLNNWGIL